MTRVESLLMDDIVRHVHVRGENGKDINAKIDIKRITFAELQSEISPFYAKKPSMKREDPGLHLFMPSVTLVGNNVSA